MLSVHLARYSRAHALKRRAVPHQSVQLTSCLKGKRACVAGVSRCGPRCAASPESAESFSLSALGLQHCEIASPCFRKERSGFCHADSSVFDLYRVTGNSVFVSCRGTCVTGTCARAGECARHHTELWRTVHSKPSLPPLHLQQCRGPCRLLVAHLLRRAGSL